MGKKIDVQNRTVPITDCMAGGTDTFRKTQMEKDLHEDLTVRAQTAPKLLVRESLRSHMKQIESKKTVNDNYKKVLRSGPLNVGRFGAKLLSHINSSRKLSDFNIDDTQLVVANEPNPWEPNALMQGLLDEDPFITIADYI